MEGSAPVLWGSKVSSVAFAHPDIGEAHADISSGAAEVYAAANATFEFLHLSYVIDEMHNIDFRFCIFHTLLTRCTILISPSLLCYRWTTPQRNVSLTTQHSSPNLNTSIAGSIG